VFVHVYINAWCEYHRSAFALALSLLGPHSTARVVPVMPRHLHHHQLHFITSDIGVIILNLFHKLQLFSLE
jgi:microsomal dipeptidase-like Zn-dependent dipeptidase